TKSTKEIFVPRDGSAYNFWLICGYGDGGVLRARGSQPVVCVGVCLLVCTGIDLRVSSRRLAIRTGRRYLVSRRAAEVVDENGSTKIIHRSKYHRAGLRSIL